MPVHSLFLKYFHESSKTGSLRLAAKNLNVTPSALSRKIREIEKELQVRLFSRSIEGVSLTAAGKLMERHVNETLDSYHRVVMGLSVFKKNQPDQITIAGPGSVIPTFLPSVMGKFHAQYSQIVTAFKGTSDIDVNHLLHHSNVDVVLGFDLPESTNSVEVNRCPLKVGAIVNPQHPLSDYKQVRISDCLSYPLVMPDPVWPLRRVLDQAIQSSGQDAEIVASSDSVEFIREVIREESCVGFATRIGLESDLSQSSLKFIPIIDKKPLFQDFVIVFREGIRETEPGRYLADLLIGQLALYRNT